MMEPTTIKLKSQEKRLFRKIYAMANKKDGERFFKMLGAIWFLQTFRYSTDTLTKVTTFECELIGVIKAKKAK